MVLAIAHIFRGLSSVMMHLMKIVDGDKKAGGKTPTEIGAKTP